MIAGWRGLSVCRVVVLVVCLGLWLYAFLLVGMCVCLRGWLVWCILTLVWVVVIVVFGFLVVRLVVVLWFVGFGFSVSSVVYAIFSYRFYIGCWVDVRDLLCYCRCFYFGCIDFLCWGCVDCCLIWFGVFVCGLLDTS